MPLKILAFTCFPPYTGACASPLSSMTQPSSLLLVDADLHGLETLTYGFEREGLKVTRTSDLSRAAQLVRHRLPVAGAVVMLREPTTTALEVIAALRGPAPSCRSWPSALGPCRRGALAEASDFCAAPAPPGLSVARPTFIRDVVNAAELATPTAPTARAPLSEYHGLFYLLRAMSAMRALRDPRLARGNRRAEIRFKDGRSCRPTSGRLQSLPALHHALLWEEAA